jgi:hypothetical protein
MKEKNSRERKRKKKILLPSEGRMVQQKKRWRLLAMSIKGVTNIERKRVSQICKKWD